MNTNTIQYTVAQPSDISLAVQQLMDDPFLHVILFVLVFVAVVETGNKIWGAFHDNRKGL